MRVGDGNIIGVTEFMRYDDPSPTEVNYIAISTGWGTSGEWTFGMYGEEPNLL